MKKLIVTTLACIFLTVTTAGGQDAMEFYNRGLKSPLTYKKIEYFTKAIQIDPNMTEAYEKRAVYYYFQRRFDKAIQDYNRVIESKPQDANAFLMRGSAYLMKEKGGGFKTEFKNLVSHFMKGRRPETSDLLDRAIEDLNRAIELNPDLANAYGYRAEAYRIKGMMEAAIHDATIAIRLGGDSKSVARAYSTRSRVYEKLGQNELSEANYKKSIALSPYTPDFPPLNVPILFHDTYDTASLKSIRFFGFLGVIVITLVVIFKLTIPAPNKKDE